MKRSPRRIGLTLLAVLACLWLVTDTLTAPLPIIKFPDLVVASVGLAEVTQADFPTAKFQVAVKNAGKAPSPPCRVALLYTINAQQSPGFLLQAGNLPAVPPGETLVAHINLLNIAKIGVPLQGMFVAVADVPVPGKPHGQVNELAGKGEYNNAFGFSVWGGEPLKMPLSGANVGQLTWYNPAAK